MTDYLIGTNSEDAVQIYPDWSFILGKKQERSDMRTKTGRRYSYKWGEYHQSHFPLKWVNSSDASTINLWFDNQSELLLFIVGSTTDVYSCAIINNDTPLMQQQKPYMEYWQGSIRLEGY